MKLLRSAPLLCTALTAACGSGISDAQRREVESLLLEGGLTESLMLAPASFTPPLHAQVPSVFPSPSWVYPDGREDFHGSCVGPHPIRALSLPRPASAGVLRWRMRPDRMDYSTSVSLRLWPSGQEPGESRAPLAISLGRAGGSGKKIFRIHGGGRWVQSTARQAAVLEGVELEVTCAWDLSARRFALSVTDAFHRTLLDESLFLGAPVDAVISTITMTLDGIRSHGKPDPQLHLQLEPFEYWDLEQSR